MARSNSHKRHQRRAAGKGGRTEGALPSGKRLDALTRSGHRATEVELSGNYERYRKAAQRLQESGATQRVIRTQHKYVDIATRAMRDEGVKGSVRNLSGTKRERSRWGD
jgi:hypothetical protein